MLVIPVADDDATLLPEERARAAQLSPVRRREFIAGRTALRRLAPHAGPILADDRGAPQLPAGLSGSISHTKDRVAAIVAPVDGGWRVGVDLEKRAGMRYDISRRILVPRELAALPSDAGEREARVLLIFSIKEAIYKAIDPFVRRYVGFQEVALDIDPGAGTATVSSAIDLAIEARFAIADGHWLSTARARLR